MVCICKLSARGGGGGDKKMSGVHWPISLAELMEIPGLGLKDKVESD